MNKVQIRTRAFISQHFPAVELADDEDIFALGFINSLFAVQLVLFVESEFGVSFAGDDLQLTNFRSLDAIARIVTRKATVASIG